MIPRTTAITLACLAGLSLSSLAAEYVGPDSTAVPTPTDNLTRMPAGGYVSTPEIGIRQRTLFREPSYPYLNTLRDPNLTPTLRPTDTLQVRGNFDIPSFRGSFPLLQRGFAPEDADLKVGPLYLKLRHVSAAVLASDNIDQSRTDRDAGAIAIVSMGAQLMAQLTEGFHIAISGTFVWLPLEGKAGVSGFGLQSPYFLDYAYNPNVRAQAMWEPILFGQPFTITDEFTMGVAQYSNFRLGNWSLIEGSEFDEQDRAGVYVFSGPRYVRRDSFDDDRDRSDIETLYYSNKISLDTGGRLGPNTVWRLNAYHQDIWYENNDYNLPTSFNRARLHIRSTRKDARLQPYFRYDLIHRDNPSNFYNQAFVGVAGQLTDLMFVRGEFGYLWDENDSIERLLWRFFVRHEPNPRTRHQFEYARALNDLADQLDQYAEYRIEKTIGPGVSAHAYAGYHWIEDLDDLAPDREGFQAGLRFSFYVSPKTSLNLTGQYSRTSYDRDYATSNNWIGRFDLHHRISEKLTSHFIYQYERNERDLFRDFYENLAYLSLSYVID